MTPAAEARGLPRPGDPWLGLAVAGWIAAGLRLDAGASVAVQRVVGAATWALLVAALVRERPMQRVQVLVALALATLGEYALSPGLGLYVYRLHDVPSFVPPGHGLVYLAALNLGRSVLTGRAGKGVLVATMAGLAAWSVWGVTVAPRQDLLGLVLFAAFAGFVWRGGSPRVYVACALLCTWLELIGTSLGNWAWASGAGPFTVGNPPSGIPGAYCVIDVVALSAGTTLARWWEQRGGISLDVRIAAREET
ncbi:MAG: hypothetical protein HYX65_08965 [Gemmatimonadetes bacterium]|nr:hypothetical protein [Gemmatimonadota bacterium]